MDEVGIRNLQNGLIDTLHRNGLLHSPEVEQAFRSVPRHIFLPNEPFDRAYADIAIAVKKNEEGRWTSSSSQPSIMAIMLEQLDLQPGQRVLEIGAGTGYNAALMASIVGPLGSVTSIDIQPDLIEQARQNLDSAGFHQVQVISADGGEGWLPGAPYDRIILTVAAWVITPAWREQLKPGGRLVMPLDLAGMQKSVAFERRDDQLFSLSLSDCGFMALQGAFAAPAPVILPLSQDERLVLSSRESLLINAEQFTHWLDTPGMNRPTGVKVKLAEALSGLLLWLETHLSGSQAILSAQGSLTEDTRIPILIGWGGETNHSDAFVLVGPDGAAALARPPGVAVPWMDWSLPEEEQPPDLPFELFVRQLGPDQDPANRLYDAVRAWDTAGRPATNNMRLRAVPADQAILPNEGELLIDRPFTKIMLRYV